MKKMFFIFLIVFILVGCSPKEDVNSFKEGYSSNIYLSSDINTLKELFKNNNISNEKQFFYLLNDFNKEKDKGCGINKKWVETKKISYNEAHCTNRYEKNHDISDGDCRITAFILIDDLLNINKKIKENGSYLMFDMEVLNNNSMYSFLKEDKEDFITLFNEIEVGNVSLDKLEDVYTSKWNDHGINIESDSVSLISVVMHDEYSNILFVGHTGVLIKESDKYLFIEKIAFEQPYQITVLKDKKELKELFSLRKEYFGGSEYGPYIYENEKLLDTYK